MYYLKLNPNQSPSQSLNPNSLHIIWAHGWGRDHSNLQPMATALQDLGHHWLLDLPGFGNTKEPEKIWGTTEYTQHIIAWIKQNLPNNSNIIWVGHSLGGRIGINLAATAPQLITGLFLIAAAGIKTPQNFAKHMLKFTKVKIFKLLKFILSVTGNDNKLNYLKNNFGSYDYRNASPNMRNILVKIINEDLSSIATHIKCNTTLVYGTKDQETPITVGQKLKELIKNSKLHILPQQDHWSVLDDSSPTKYLLKNFINDIMENQQ